MVDAIVVGKKAVGYGGTFPTRHIAGVGVANVVYVLSTSTDEIPEFIAAPCLGWRLVITFEVVIFRIAVSGIPPVITFPNDSFHVDTAIIAVAQIFGTHDGRGELAQNGGLQVAEGLVHDVLKLCLVVEGQAANAEFRQQVVFAHFAPAVVTVVVESAVEAGVIHVGRQLVLVHIIKLCIAKEETERHDADVAAEDYHLNAVVFVFLDDVVADLLWLVAALHGGINLFQSDDAGADAFVVVEVEIFPETRNPFLGGDDEHVVAADFASTLVVGAQHIGVLRQTLQRSLVFGREPKLAAVVVAACGGLNGDFYCLCIADLACGRHITQRRETTEGQGHTIQILCADLAVTFCGISVFRTIEALVFGEWIFFFVGISPRLLVGIEVEVAFKFHKVGKLYVDGCRFLTLGQHQADVLPRQSRLPHDAVGQATFEANLLVAIAFADSRLAKMIGLFDSLGLRKHRGGQKNEDKT